MAELVHEDEHPEDEQKGKDGQEVDFTPGVALAANARAQPSIFRTSARPATCPPPCRSYSSIVLPMMSAMPGNARPPSMKADTAISLAAFRTIDSPSAPRKARKASARHGNRPTSGFSN